MKTKLFFFGIILASTGLLYAQVPDSPVLTEPPNLNVVTSSTFTLDWTDVFNANCYIVEVNTDVNFTGTSIINDTVYAKSYYEIPLGILSPNTLYYWRARACNEFGASIWSAVWTFRTAASSREECDVLDNDIETLVASGILTHGQGNSLEAKINGARTSLDNNNNNAAINELNAFKNHVLAYLKNNHIPESTGQMLLDRADYIISIINLGNSPVLQGEPIRDYVLNQNYPNPFNPSTVISYSIPQTSHVLLKVYDITGQEAATLVDGILNAGRYDVTWNADNYSTGVYIYTLSTVNYSKSRLMLLNK